jgi:hypothetical protein
MTDKPLLQINNLDKQVRFSFAFINNTTIPLYTTEIFNLIYFISKLFNHAVSF